jgi:hypothetical protein
VDEVKCIYCGKSDDLSISDIIPDSITTAKCKNNNVCKACNNLTNSMFENMFANQFAFFRNQLGYTKRNTNQVVSFEAHIYVNKKPNIRTKCSYRTRFTTYKDFVLKNCILDDKMQIIGLRNTKPIYRNLKNPKIWYVCPVNYKKLFLSTTTLRTVAKICYEWHCKQNSINHLSSRYNRIINYIHGRSKNTIIEVVSDRFFKEHTVYMLGYCQGSHALVEFVENDKRYVLFSLFGVIWYKVKICKYFKSSARLEVLHQYSLDNEIRINTSSAMAVQMGLGNPDANYIYNYFPKPNTVKVHDIKKEDGVVWDIEMKQLLGGLIITRQEIYRLVSNLEKDDFLNQNAEYYHDSIFYQERRKIQTIILLYTISTVGYDNQNSFFRNIETWVNESIKVGTSVDFWSNVIVAKGFDNFLSQMRIGYNILKSIPLS